MCSLTALRAIEERMNFNEYQAKAKYFAEFESYLYPFMALPEETGEFLSLMAKSMRGDNLTERFGSDVAVSEAFLKEAGDILWQLSMCLEALGLSLQEAAEMNIEKLESRKQRGVIKGSGDDR